jgi:4-amino-4-deoxy-L-arabinose transferase-like glycosyltransferase
LEPLLTSNRSERTQSPLQGKPFLQLALCLLAALWALLPWLGAGGLNASEGLRVAAGLDFALRQTPITAPPTDDTWLRQTIFEQPYLRKPPGLPWTIASLHEIFGFSQWVFRLPSVLSQLALVILIFTFTWRIVMHVPGADRRHSLAALWAGLATALSPLLWEFSRASELESLTITTGAMAALGILAHGFVAQGLLRTRTEGLLWLLIAALGMLGTLLTKGPAMLPVIGACFLAITLVPAWMFKGQRALLETADVRSGLLTSLSQLAALAIGAAAAIALLTLVAKATGTDDAVKQSPAEFLWARDRITGIATLPFTALATMLPAAFAIAWLFWPRLSNTQITPTLQEHLREQTLRRVFIIAATFSLLIFAAAGISNPRYAAPAIVPILLLVGIAVTRHEHLHRATAILQESLPAIAQRLRRWLGFMKNTAIVLLIACLIAAPIYAYLTNQSRLKNSGRSAALALAPRIKPGGLLYADHALEARAEILLYLRQFASQTTPPTSLRPIWLPGLDGQTIMNQGLPKDGAIYLLLRSDGRESEKARFLRDHPTWKLSLLQQAKVHIFEFELFRVDSFGPP